MTTNTTSPGSRYIYRQKLIWKIRCSINQIRSTRNRNRNVQVVGQDEHKNSSFKLIIFIILFYMIFYFVIYNHDYQFREIKFWI